VRANSAARQRSANHLYQAPRPATGLAETAEIALHFPVPSQRFNRGFENGSGIISNCVINLSPDKPAVFREIYRVLKPGGRFAVGDIVLLANLPEQIRNDVTAYVGCIAGASELTDYVRYALDAGLADLAIPQITPGTQLAALLSLGSTADELQTATAAALASIKLHGHKPE